LKIFKTFTTKKDGNIAYHVTDDKKSVDGARLKLAKKHNFDISTLHYMDQIHSNIVEDISPTNNRQTCDALVTNKPNTPLLVMVADCIPILFYDDTNYTIGVAHAGRNGTFQNISANTVKKMIDDYSCKAKDIKVEMGPSIQKCCYEVSCELANITIKSFGKVFEKNRYIDLQGINKMQLLALGVKEENITISNICTKCSNEPYFSYRKNNKCGRFGGIIMIKTK